MCRSDRIQNEEPNSSECTPEEIPPGALGLRNHHSHEETTEYRYERKDHRGPMARPQAPMRRVYALRIGALVFVYMFNNV